MDKGGRAHKRAIVETATVMVAVLALVGCPESDPVETITDPGTGTNVLANFVVSSGDGFGMPTSDYSTPGLTDAFSRATGALGFRNTDNAFNFTTYNFHEFVRSVTEDPRLPALDAATAGATAGTATFGVPFCLLGDANWMGANGFWNLWCEVDGVKPSTRYTVVLAQLQLQVNGELDTRQILEGQPVDAPDELSVLPGGTLRGHPTSECNFTVGVAVPADANPLVVGFADSDATGNLVFDCVPTTDGSSWYSGGTPVLTNLPFMPNEPFATTQPPFTYNYLYLVEGQGTAQNPLPSGPIPVRIQIGPDVRTDGLPHFNAYAPFPTEASAVPPQPELILEVGPLPELTGNAVHQVWLHNTGDNTSIPLTARSIVRIDAETGEEETIATNTRAAVSGAGAAADFRFNVFMEDNGAGLLDFNHVLVTQETSATAAQPSNSIFLFKNFADISDPLFPVVEGTGSLTFGTFDLSTGAPARTWGFAGEGLAHFFGNEFRARVNNLARPPVGFAYYGWLDGEDADGDPIFHSLGPLTVDNPPTYTSLADADVSRDLPSAGNSVVARTFIAEAISRALISDIPSLEGVDAPHPFCTVTGYRVTLEAKAGGEPTEPGPTVAIVGSTPEAFLRSPQCR